ncbi:hypothetical protein D3C81_1680450 [compost metagenome]
MAIDRLVDVQAGFRQARAHYRQGNGPGHGSHGPYDLAEGPEVADPQLLAQVGIGAQGELRIVGHARVSAITQMAECIT